MFSEPAPVITTGSDVTIGNGITFVDTSIINIEMQRKLDKIKRKDPALREEKKLAQEAYEKEIQEKQYKRLMHLLSQSKAFSNFMSKKVSEGPKEKKGKGNRKRKSSTKDVETDDPPPNKRGRKPKNKKVVSYFVSNYS